MVGGMAWALIPGILKVRFNTNEILVSLMLTYVAALFIDWLVRGPWRDPQSFGFPLTKSYDEAALIQRVDLPGIGTLGQLHWGVVAALVLALVAYFVMSRTLFGFQVKVMGMPHGLAHFPDLVRHAQRLVFYVFLGLVPVWLAWSKCRLIWGSFSLKCRLVMALPPLS